MPRLRRARRAADDLAAIVADFDLPTFPQVPAEALQLLADPDVTMSQVGAVVERDPGTSVHLLRVANSASSGLRSAVDSVDRAVAMLGRNQLESVLIGRAVVTSLAPAHPVVDLQRFWATAAMRAVVASEVATLTDPGRRSEHSTAALLQDMAIVVLVDHVAGYDELLSQWYQGRIDDLAAEEADRFGWDHAEIAAGMARAWNFPALLVDAVATHHDDDQQSPGQLVSGWHEVDDDRGPAWFRERASHVAELEAHVERVLESAAEQAGDMSAIYRATH